MINFLRKLFGMAPPARVSAPAKGAPVASAPASGAAVAKPAKRGGQSGAGDAVPAPAVHSFVCREPILDRNERIAGYEFILSEKIQSRLQGELELVQKIYDDALLRNLASLDSETLLGSRLAFVQLSPASLGNPLIQHLPAKNTVLLLTPSRNTLEPELVGSRLQTLRAEGYAHGVLLRKAQLDDNPPLLQLAACADFVQIEANGFDGMEIKLLIKSLQAARPAVLPRLRLVASELDAFDDFHLCFQGGFDYFFGRFVTSRENWHPPKSDINRLRVIELLNLLRSGAEFDLIAKQLKLDPILTFKLLRYLNSPLMGLQSAVTTMDKALMVLGREKFYRWLSLLLFDIRTPGYRERVLTEQALARAHFLEGLAAQGNLPANREQLFTLGLFSLLDLLMGQPMSEILAQARVAEAVRDALLDHPGPFRDALLLAIAAEGPSPETLEQRAAVCGVDALQVSLSAIESLAWAHEISSLDAG